MPQVRIQVGHRFKVYQVDGFAIDTFIDMEIVTGKKIKEFMAPSVPSIVYNGTWEWLIYVDGRLMGSAKWSVVGG